MMATNAPDEKAKPAIVLLSGGLDSTTCLALAQDQGFVCYALSFRYGQRHLAELESARKVARAFGVKEHLTLDIDLGAVGGSALTTADIDVPKGRSTHDLAASESAIPITYVPARNTIFLSFALAWAEVLGVCDIFIGVNALDYSGYPDCRPPFIEAFENLAQQATRLGVQNGREFKIHAPLMQLDKSQIVRKGLELGVDYGLTHSCYDPATDGRACGLCDACQLRRNGFAQAGLEDPLKYAGD